MAQVYLKDYIEHLQMQLEKHGNLPVYHEEDGYYYQKEMLGKSDSLNEDTWYPECTKIVENAMKEDPEDEDAYCLIEHCSYHKKVDKSQLFKIIVV